jgi:HEAT repeat protein
VQVKKGNDLNVVLHAASEFDITLRAPKPGELEAVYQPLFEELYSRNFTVQQLAASAVTQNPPPFAEATILKFANDSSLAYSSMAAGHAIDGLKRLATAATRAKLLEMASTTSPEHVRQPAIEALGEIGNPDDCQTMLAIAGASQNYTQAEAYIAAGRICKERALPGLAGLVGSGDSQLLMGVAGGLENTSSREAVSLLITLLQSPDRDARQHAAAGLATLTHRKSTHGVEDEHSAKQSHAEWLNWWSVNGGTATIYGYDRCVTPQPLL